MTRAYITKADAKLLVGLAEADTKWDTHIDSMIEAVCHAVDLACKRTFVVSVDESEIRYFHTEAGRKMLSVDDIRTLAKLEWDYAGDGTFSVELVENTDFILEPMNETPKKWITLLPDGKIAKFVQQYRAIKATALWGYGSEVPDAVKQACKMIVTRLYKRKDTSFATMISSTVFDGVEIYRGLDPDVSMLLVPVKRRRLIL